MAKNPIKQKSEELSEAAMLMSMAMMERQMTAAMRGIDFADLDSLAVLGIINNVDNMATVAPKYLEDDAIELMNPKVAVVKNSLEGLLAVMKTATDAEKQEYIWKEARSVQLMQIIDEFDELANLILKCWGDDDDDDYEDVEDVSFTKFYFIRGTKSSLERLLNKMKGIADEEDSLAFDEEEEQEDIRKDPRYQQAFDEDIARLVKKLSDNLSVSVNTIMATVEQVKSERDGSC